MDCPSCGSGISDDTSQCPVCGFVIEHEPTVTYVPIDLVTEIEEPTAVAAAGIEGYALTVASGPRAGMTYVLKEGSTTVGRHTSSDIFLDDITVSRHHCRFIVGPDQLSVEDSGSTNGTYVNGDRVDRGDLQAGDEVIVGKFHLIVSNGHGRH